MHFLFVKNVHLTQLKVLPELLSKLYIGCRSKIRSQSEIED